MEFMNRYRSTSSKQPQVLKGKDTASLAEYMKSKECKTVMLMLGAGRVSTLSDSRWFSSYLDKVSALLPEFQILDRLIRANLEKLNLPYPEAVFEINYFRRNPVPFYTLAHELYPGKFRPTLSHSFLVLLAQKGLLHTCFTQNIDTLERRAGLPERKIVEAHGSFASQRCVSCKKEYDGDKMREHVKRKEVARCESCKGYVKPDIVFFGEGLAPSFSRAVQNLPFADLLIVMGTSLTVHPFASLAGMVSPNCPRVLINLEKVGNFGSRPEDLVLLGKCDDIVRDLCRALEWEEELDELWRATEASVLTEAPTTATTAATTPKDLPPKADGVKKADDDAEEKDDDAEKKKVGDGLESVEAQLAGLSMSDKKEEADTSDSIIAPSAATMAQKVAKQVSTAMREAAEDTGN